MRGRIYETKCTVCGAVIVSNRLDRKVCSPECLKEYRRRLAREYQRRQRATMICAYCKQEFIPARAGQIYCRRKCAVSAKNVLKNALYITNDKKPLPLVRAAGGPATRTCLCCGRQFASSWIGNRMCEACQKYAGRERAAAEA